MTLWSRCEKPIHIALLGACICRHMAGVVGLGQERLRDLSVQMEQLAISAMDDVDESVAFEVCSQSPTHDSRNDVTLLDVARLCKCKAFLAQHHCKVAMDEWWRGGFDGSSCQLRHNFSWWLLMLYCMAPFLNPYIISWKSSARRELVPKVERDRMTAHAQISALSTLAWHVEKQQKRNAHVRNSQAQRHWPRRPSRQLQHESSIRWKEQVHGSTKPPTAAKIISPGNAMVGACASGCRSLATRASAFYSIPAVIFLQRFIFHMVLLLVYALRIAEVDQQPYDSRLSATAAQAMGQQYEFGPIEIAWLILEAGVFLDSRHAKAVQDRRGLGVEQDGFERFVNVNNVVLILAVGCRVASQIDEDGPYYSIYLTLIALNSLIVSLLVLPFMSRFHTQFGILVIVVEHMMLDVLLFLELFVRASNP